MFGNVDAETRRNVLRTVGGALGAVTLSSAVTADGSTTDVSPGDCVAADGPDGAVLQYDECGGTDPVSRVENGRQGTVHKVCRTEDETLWASVTWDDISLEHWVRQAHLSGCVQPHLSE